MGDNEHDCEIDSMGMIIDGIWQSDASLRLGRTGWEPRREPFRKRVTADGSSGFPAERGRYHLIGCPGCPHAHRTAIVRRLKQLDGVVSTTEVRPVMGEDGREFGNLDTARVDPVTGFRYLYEVYIAADPEYTGRASTPVLWDRNTRALVSNNTDDIFAMLNREFDALTPSRDDFRPEHLVADIDRLKGELYERFVAVVYRCGFARDQDIYDLNITVLAEAIDELEMRLGRTPFLLGNAPTEADWMLFVSLVRYDAIYHVLFRCTSRRIDDCPNLTAYIRRLYEIPGIAETFDLGIAMQHYYLSHVHINPTAIVPKMPRLSWREGEGD